MSEDAGIEPRTVATFPMAVRRSNLSARSQSHPQKMPFSILRDAKVNAKHLANSLVAKITKNIIFRNLRIPDIFSVLRKTFQTIALFCCVLL
jgi:hypothetical protein